MKTALCLSGELRRVKLFFPAIKKHILDAYAPDVFISTWDMPQGIITSKGNTQRDPKEISSIEYVTNLYKPVGLHVQQYTNEIKQYLIGIGNTPHDNLLCMAFNIFKSYCLAHDRAIITGGNYDLVIRHRLDYGVKVKFEDYDLEKINIPEEHSYGGYQDQFAFGNQHAMFVYAQWFINLHQIENRLAQTKGLPTTKTNSPGYPWHPESALKRYLDTTEHPINLIENIDIRYPWCTQEEIEELYD